MPRQSTLVAIFLLLATFMVAGTQSAYAHGAHRMAAAVTVSSTGAELAFAIESAQKPLTDISIHSTLPRGDVSVVAIDGAGDPANDCHGAVSCCAFHCCVAGALVAEPPELPLLFEAAAAIVVTASQPDDAPSKTRLRPPCR